MSYFHELKFSAHATFCKLKDLEGQAEVYFIAALQDIMDPSGKPKQARRRNVSGHNLISPMESGKFDASLIREAKGSQVSDATEFNTNSELVRIFNPDREEDELLYQ